MHAFKIECIYVDPEPCWKNKSMLRRGILFIGSFLLLIYGNLKQLNQHSCRSFHFVKMLHCLKTNFWKFWSDTYKFFLDPGAAWSLMVMLLPPFICQQCRLVLTLTTNLMFHNRTHISLFRTVDQLRIEYPSFKMLSSKQINNLRPPYWLKKASTVYAHVWPSCFNTQL